MGAPYPRQVRDEALHLVEAARDAVRIAVAAGKDYDPNWYGTAIASASEELGVATATVRNWARDRGLTKESVAAPDMARALGELIDTLPRLVARVQERDQDIAAELKRLPPATVVEISGSVLQETDKLLTPTNPEILAFATADKTLRSFASRYTLQAVDHQSRHLIRIIIALWALPVWVFTIWTFSGLFESKFGGAAVAWMVCVATLLLLFTFPKIAPVIKLHYSLASGGEPGKARSTDWFVTSRSFSTFISVVAAVDALLCLLIADILVGRPVSISTVLTWLAVVIVALLLNLMALVCVNEGADPAGDYRMLHLATMPSFLTIVSVVSIGYATRYASVVNDRTWAFGIAVCGVLVNLLVARLALLRLERKSGTVSNRRKVQVQEQRFVRELAAARRAWEQAAEEQIGQMLRLAIRGVLRPPFSTKLTLHDTAGLKHLRNSEVVVRTSSFRELARKLDQLSGGTVGIAGSRGAGKTTLLEYYRDGRLLESAGKRHLAVFLNAPVRFDARDFAIYLFGQLCECIRDFARSSGATLPPAVRTGRPARRVSLLLPIMVLVALCGVAAATFKYLSGQTVLISPSALAVTVVLAVTTGVLVVVIFLLLTRRHQPGNVAEFEERVQVSDLATLLLAAEQNLELVNYQQTHTSGWGGKLAVPFGAEGSLSRTQQFARRPLAYPDVVYEIHRFLTSAITVLRSTQGFSEVPLAVVLDELDKISGAENVQDFLNELKALFSLDQPGCLFLVSVSEDALAAFERRGLPVRDVLDSTFDEVLSVPYLTLADSRELLQSRIIGMPDPFICLCHCLAGGLPRDLIRFARQITDQPPFSDLAEVARSVVAADLRRKAIGLKTVMTTSRCIEPQTSRLLSRMLATGWSSAAEILAAARSFEQVEERFSGDEQDASLASFQELERETLAFVYYSATVVEVFSDFTPEKMKVGSEALDGRSLNYLATVRQLFSVNVRLAWEANSAFRRAWGLEPIELPVAPQQGLASKHREHQVR